MAIHGLCCATNIRKYDCKFFFFLTFKCYCFHQTSCVAVHSSSGHVWQMAEESCLGGLLFFGPHRAASWTNHKHINNWVSHPKHWDVGSLKILWLVIMYPLPPPEQPSTHPPVVSLITSVLWCGAIAQEPCLPINIAHSYKRMFHFSWLKHLDSTENIWFVSNNINYDTMLLISALLMPYYLYVANMIQIRL